MFAGYFPVVVIFVFSIALAIILLCISRFVGWRRPTWAKSQPFECGMLPMHDAVNIQFDVKFYLTALFFLIFDMETIFVLLWAVNFQYFKEIGIAGFAFFQMLFFITVLIVGYVYAWKRGGLTWK